MASQEGGNAQTENAPNPPKPFVRPIHEPPHASPTKDQRDNDSSDSDSDVDKAMVRWTKAVAAFTFCLFIAAILQFCAMRGQQSVMKGQLAEMQAQEQPWIKFTAMATGIDFDPKTGDATFNYKFSMKNVGNSMARNIRLTYSETIVLPHSAIGMFTVFDLEKAGCAKQIANNATANEDAINGGEVLFPGETSLNDPNAYYWSQETIPIAQIKSAALPIMPEDFSAYWVGCVTYNTSYESTRHETDFIYDVNGLDPSDPYKIPRLLKIGHSLSADELLLRDDNLSGGGMN